MPKRLSLEALKLSSFVTDSVRSKSEKMNVQGGGSTPDTCFYTCWPEDLILTGGGGGGSADTIA